MSETPAGPRRLAALGFALAALAVLATHLWLVDYFFAGCWPLPEQPLNRGDFSTHATQARRVIQGFEASGRHWVYDVQLLAGAPNGVLFDADVKGWELWTYALVELGVGFGRAYNSFILALHLAAPLAVYAAARVFGSDRGASLTAAALAVLLWSFDSFTHWMWFIGTVSYVLVSYYALLPLALFHRWLERGPQGRRDPAGLALALACALSLALGHLLHPYIFFILVAPMLALYLRAHWGERQLRWGDHALVLVIVALTLAVNGWWLRTAAHFFHYILDSAFYAQGGLHILVYDLLGLLHDPGTQGMLGVRVGVRLLALFAALAGLRAWRRRGDRRRLPFLVLIAAMAALTYLGAYTPATQIQPYRHALPLGFALLIPAGAWLSEQLRARSWRGGTSQQRALLGLAGLLALMGLARDLQYFFSPSMTKVQQLDDGRQVFMNSLGHSLSPVYRYDQQHHWEALIAKVDALDQPGLPGKPNEGRGRWLIFDQVLGEYLMARTDAQVIGGFLVRNLEHSDANWFRRHGRPPYDAAALREYLDTYAIRWVIVPKIELHPFWDAHPQLLSRAGFADEMIIYQVNAHTKLLDGPGQLSATHDRIEVRGSDPDSPQLLRFHWMETLACEGLEGGSWAIERAELEHDRVGFIRIPAPHPADFAVVNAGL